MTILRRDSFRSFYCLEATSGAVLPLMAILFVAIATGHSAIAAAALFLTIWYGAEMLLCAAAGWHLPLLYPVHAMLRDILLPVLWVEGWREAAFVWRGNAMSLDEGSAASNEAGSAT